LWAKEDHNAHEVVVGVSNNGPGIDAAELSEIFKRFKQLETQFKCSTKGFGLGLNIAKELVNLNLGEMSVESEAGHGATFFFTLPMNDPQSIVARYLTRLGRLKSIEPVVALVRAQIDDGVSAKIASEADAFLNYLLRRNDLLFRVDAHGWLLVLPIPLLELSCFAERVEDEWTKTNRNRPLGPLPRFEITTLGKWPVPSCGKEILDRVAEQLRPGAGIRIRHRADGFR